MRIVVLLIVAGSALAAGHAVGEQRAVAKPGVEASPHAQALRLVFEKRAERIRAVDEEDWWHDVKSRGWFVKRPFPPGVIDSTHLFDVRYEIDGKPVAAWSVDTRAGTVEETPVPAEPPVK